MCYPSVGGFPPGLLEDEWNVNFVEGNKQYIPDYRELQLGFFWFVCFGGFFVLKV